MNLSALRKEVDLYVASQDSETSCGKTTDYEPVVTI